MIRNLVTLALTAALLVPSAALAVRAPKKVHFLRAPRMDLPAYSTIGVVGVDGWAGRELESALVTAFLDANRGLGRREGREVKRLSHAPTPCTNAVVTRVVTRRAEFWDTTRSFHVSARAMHQRPE